VKTIVVYDSLYGNTEQIAQAIGAAIVMDIKVMRASEVKASDLEYINLLIVGSPTQGAKPTSAVQEFINKIPDNSLSNINVASFDTRISDKSGGIGTRLIARMAGGFGYAAGWIADNLKAKGGYIIKPPEGFIVNGVKGPLKEKELEHTTSWAKGILESKLSQ
jgi:flavodoxin I